MAIPVTRSSMPSYEEYCGEIRSVFDNRWLTNMGPKHQELEQSLASYLRVRYLSLFSNGHSALECVLEAMGLEGEVITTPFTFVSTTNAIVRKGLAPVFCDIRRSDYTMDPELVEPLVTERTCAIVPVHVYGCPCDVEAIRAIADKYSLKVIYDAAHAFGVTVDGAGIAGFGDASMLSFHATKVFNTIEGGAVATCDENLYAQLAKWKNFGIANPEEVEFIGGNAKMNEFAAAMGVCNLRHVDEEIAKRRLVVERYRERLSEVSGLKLLASKPGVRENCAYFPVVFEESFGSTRDEVFERLADQGVHARKYFYPLVSDYACYRKDFGSACTPIAKDVASRVMTLPLYADLDIATVDRICDIVLA